MSTETSAPADPEIAVYTTRTLGLYDLLVHRVSNRLVWRCPLARLVDHYDRHVSRSHLDVGPGTGLLIDRCRFPTEQPDLTLLDANPAVLAYAASRLARYAPRTVQADIRRPLLLDDGGFDSIGLSYVLHCIPTTMAQKIGVLQRLAALLAPTGVLFGSTILAAGVPQTRRSRAVLRLYNRKQIFGNADDHLDDLEAGLARVFPHYDLEVVGSVALFSASRSHIRPDD